jgi:hypothetical protein
MNEDQFEKLARLISESHDDLAERIDRLELRIGNVESGIESLKSEMHKGFRDIRSQLSDIEKRLKIVEEQTASNSGLPRRSTCCVTRCGPSRNIWDWRKSLQPDDSAWRHIDAHLSVRRGP